MGDQRGPPVSVQGPGLLDVAVWTQHQSMTVHLVNLTNPMMMKGPVREIIPMPEQQVRIKIPAGRRVIGAQLLVSKRQVHYKEANGIIRN